MSNVPDDCLYTKEHEWIRVEGGRATIGITDYAAHELGDVTYVEVPSLGRELRQFGAFASVESVKAVSDVFAPASGKVVEVNGDLEGEPGLVNEDPYAGGFICRIEPADKAELEGLLSPDAYRALLAELEE
jgi:glycine cleavage system H protein